MTAHQRIAIVGIGADGWAGLGERAREEISSAELLIGSRRQLALLPPELPATRRPWPSPIEPLLAELTDGIDARVCVLASGDPMLHGIGATLARRLGSERLRVHPHLSTLALACARLGWPEDEVAVVRRADELPAWLAPRRRILALAPATEVATVLAASGLADQPLVVLEQLGGARERITHARAGGLLDDHAPGEPPNDRWPGNALDDRWPAEPLGGRSPDPLHAVALRCPPRDQAPRRAAPLHPRQAGLPDELYEHDGQLTKWPVRAVTLAALAPAPGELLWDIGAGSGSVAIEWLRAEPTTRAIAIERRADRAARIRANARRLGVPRLQVLEGEAPAALAGLQTPDAIFIGGDVSAPGLIEACAALTGARIVANAVTLEGERALQEAHRRMGGRLIRLEISAAEPLGSHLGWRPARPIVQWSSPPR